MDSANASLLRVIARSRIGLLVFWMLGIQVASSQLINPNSCHMETVGGVVAKNHVDLALNGSKILAAGLLLVGAREGSTIVQAGSAIAMLAELPAFASTINDTVQLSDAQNDSKHQVKVCEASSDLARAFNFRTLQVIEVPHRSASGNVGTTWHTTGIDPSVINSLQRNQHLFSQAQPRTETLPPTHLNSSLLSDRPQMDRPVHWHDLLAAPQSAFSGRAVDGKTGLPLKGALVQLTIANGQTIGGWQLTLTPVDGSFQFTVPTGDYLLQVDAPNYRPYSGTFNLSSTPRPVTIPLQAASRYPCQFSVLNETGWVIRLYGNQPLPFIVAPWSSYHFTVNGPLRVRPLAFVDGQTKPISWPESSVNCDGSGLLKLSP